MSSDLILRPRIDFCYGENGDSPADKEEDRTTAVSYTHLDVYKRQYDDGPNFTVVCHPIVLGSLSVRPS